MNWTGHGDQLIGIHAMLGFLLVLSLWAIAAIAARSGVSIGLVALAVACGVAAPILAGAVIGRAQPDGPVPLRPGGAVAGADR